MLFWGSLLLLISVFSTPFHCEFLFVGVPVADVNLTTSQPFSIPGLIAPAPGIGGEKINQQ